MAAKGAQEPLRLRGTPLSLTGLMPAPPAPPAPEAASRQLPVRLAPVAEERRAALATASATAAGPTALLTRDGLVRLSLPRQTPPGTYPARLQIGDREQEILIEVEPEVELRASPDSLTVEGAPGGRVGVELTLLNVGNVAAEIRRAHGFGLFAVEGADRAIGRAFSGDPPAGKGRADQLAEALAEEHGGLVRIQIDSGDGEIAPGEVRRLHLTLVLPNRLSAGRTYWGVWNLHDLGYCVTVVVPESSPLKAKRRKSNE